MNPIAFLFLIFWVWGFIFIDEEQYPGHWYMLAYTSCLINSYLAIISRYEGLEIICVGKWKSHFISFEADDKLWIKLETDRKLVLVKEYNNGTG